MLPDTNEGRRRRLSLLPEKEVLAMTIDHKAGRLIIWGEGTSC
jgi:hypothetical protein